MQVNRCLKDKKFDHIDHALGRPVDPTKESYRNYFSVKAKSPRASMMRASKHWRESRPLFGSTTFFVTAAGREALKKHLAKGASVRLAVG